MMHKFDLANPYRQEKTIMDNRRKKIHLLATGLLLVLTLTGCASATSSPLLITPEDLCGINPKAFDQYTLPVFENWVLGRSGTETEATGDIYQWKEGVEKDVNIYWVAGFQQEKLAYLSGSNLPKQYRFRDLVHSFGEPESVSRFRDNLHETVYETGLDFPGIGITAYSWDTPKLRSNEKEIQLNDSATITEVLCYRPSGTMKAVIQDGLNLSPTAAEIQIARRLPWPGFESWISIENVP